MPPTTPPLSVPARVGSCTSPGLRHPRRAVAAALVGALFWPFSASAAINPANPGLAPAEAYGQKAIANNGASALCVECHGVNPKPGGGSHFVLNAATGTLRRTNSGGGWTVGAWGVRDSGEFFKLTTWLEEEWGNGGASKYGDADTWESVVYAAPEGLVGAEAARLETNPATMTTLEVICESCHSLRTNVEGRYNLLCKVTDSATLEDTVEGATAPLCIGCHGFLYQVNEANAAHANWNHPANFGLAEGTRRGNNEVHYIGGLAYPRNHHVMTGDAIVEAVAQAGLLVRDVTILSKDLESQPIRTDSRKGTMPLRALALLPLVLPTERANLHCVTCHAPGHGGDPTMGAAILRGENLGGKDVGFGIDRIVDGKEWGRYRDSNFCGQCHE